MESPMPSSPTSQGNYDIDDRPTKRACFEALRNDLADLPKVPVDGSDLYDTPAAFNTPAKMEGQAELPDLAPTSSFPISGSIPGLGLLHSGGRPEVAEMSDQETTKQYKEVKQSGTEVEQLNVVHEASTTEMEPLKTETLQADIQQTEKEATQFIGEHTEPDNRQPGTKITQSSTNEPETEAMQPGVSQPETDFMQPRTADGQLDPIIAQSEAQPEIQPPDMLKHLMQSHVVDTDTKMADERLSHPQDNTFNDMEDACTRIPDATIAQESKESEPPRPDPEVVATTLEIVGDLPECHAAAPTGEIVFDAKAIEASSNDKIEKNNEAPDAQERDLEMAGVGADSRPQALDVLPVEGSPKEAINEAALPASSDMKEVLERALPDPTPDLNNLEWEADSSPYQSSSSSSSDSSSDSSSEEDSDEDDYKLLSPSEQVRILMQEERGGSDDEDQGPSSRGKDPASGPSRLRTTNEQAEAIIPIPDINLTFDSKITHLGVVESIVENTLLVKAGVAGEYQVLESGSVLCVSDRSIIGVVAETLGRVQQPLYTVRFSNPAAIHERGVGEKGTEVFYVDDHSSFVFTQALKGIKGSDASNIHDEEVGEHEMEFSDDEKEAEYRRQLKVKKRNRRGGDDGFTRPPRGGLRQSGYGYSNVGSDARFEHAGSMINYDDSVGDTNIDDAFNEGYTPLARPSNLHEMMGREEAPQENWNPNGSHPRPDSHALDDSRRRGGHRGGVKGGRGRDNRGRGRDRRGFDNRRNGQNQDSGRPPQPLYSPQSSQFNSPASHSQVQQQPQPHSGPTSTSSQSFADGYPQQQPPQQNFHQPPFGPPSQPSLSNSPSLQFNQQTYSQPQHYPNQSQSSYYPSSPNPSAYPPPGSHINPAVWAALQQQQQQQQAYSSHTQSQSYPPPPAQNQMDWQQNGHFQGNGAQRGAGAAEGQTEGFGGGISEILRRLGPGPGSSS